mmetsp:Transcript_18987/g.27723  ORF Transcript_18987/g.27723 Transcript_18987/m.27723 type:complete len:350 (-) Transcript_18987:72-1121(-)
MLHKITAIKNPNECEGYVPCMLDKAKTHQIDFFLPDKKMIDPGDDLACSLIPAPSSTPGPSQSKSPNDTEHAKIVLEELDRTKPLIIIAHGHRSWRNQLLLCKFASEISSSLDCHTLRFDFTACGHSKYDNPGGFDCGYGPGADKHKWLYSNFEEDYKDLCRVIDFVQEDLNIHVSCMIAHSQGSAAMFRYAADHDNDDADADANTNAGPLYVNLSGAYYGHTEHKYVDFFSDVFTDRKRREFEVKGRVITEVKGGRKLELKTKDVERRDTFDMHSTIEKIQNAKVLTIHGEKDPLHPVANAHRFDEVLPKENHTMEIIPGANHTYNGFKYAKTMMAKIEEFVRSNTSD